MQPNSAAVKNLNDIVSGTFFQHECRLSDQVGRKKVPDTFPQRSNDHD